MSTDQPIPPPPPPAHPASPPSFDPPASDHALRVPAPSTSSKNLLGLGLPATTTTPANPSSLSAPSLATPTPTSRSASSASYQGGESVLHQYPHLGHYIFQLVSSLHTSPPRPGHAHGQQHPLAVSSSGESDDENTPPVSRDESGRHQASRDNGDPPRKASESLSSSVGSGSDRDGGHLSSHYAPSSSRPGSRRVSKVEVDKEGLVRRIVELLDADMEEQVKDILRPMMGDLGKDEILMEQVCLDCMHKRRDDQENMPYQPHLTPTRPRMSPQVSSTILRPYTPTRLPSFRSITPLGRPQSPNPSGAQTPTHPGVGIHRSDSSSKLSIGGGSATTSPSAVPGVLSAKATAFNPVPRLPNPPSSAGAATFDPADAWKDVPPEPPRTASPFMAQGMARTGSNRAIVPLFSDQSSPFHSPLGTPNRGTIKMPDVFSSPSLSHARPAEPIMRTNSAKDIIPDDDDDDEFSPFGRGLPKLHHHSDNVTLTTLNSAAKPFEPMSGGRIDNVDQFGSSSTLSSSIPHSDSSRESFDSASNSSNNLAAAGGGGDDVEAGSGMTPLDVLHSVFTSVPRIELEQALHQSGYDFEAAMASLVSQYTLPRSGSSTPGRASPRPMFGVGARGAIGTAHMAPPSGYFDRGGRGVGGLPFGGPGAGHGMGARTPGGLKMCRYFLAGECRRSDCRFSHDLDRALCRFWLRGSCAKGPNCEFLHQLPPNFQSFDPHALSSAMSRLELSQDGSYRHHSGGHTPAEDFPDLMGGRFRPGARFDPSRNRFANALKRPVAPHAAHAAQSHVQVTGARMGISHPGHGSNGATAAAGAYGDLRSSPSAASATVSLPQPRPSTRIKLRAPTLLPTIQTGTTANEQYMTTRATSIRLGHARNACLARAADAFRRGDGAAAKRFSREGKSLNEKMLAEAAEAAEKLVRDRQGDAARAVRERDPNWSDDPLDRSARGKAAGGGLGVVLGVASRRAVGASGAESSDERVEVMVDLHTLHGNEGVDVLSHFLSELEKENFRGLTYVLVGEEKHVGAQDPLRGTSKVRLGASVKSYLAEWGYAWLEGSGWICVDSCR